MIHDGKAKDSNIIQGYNEALALVNVHKSVAGSNSPDGSGAPAGTTPDAGEDQSNKKQSYLQQAKELVALHYEVKSKHANGEVDDGLRRAREEVEQVLWELA